MYMVVDSSTTNGVLLDPNILQPSPETEFPWLSLSHKM